MVIYRLVVLEDKSLASRILEDSFQVLGLGLEDLSQVLGLDLGLEPQVLGLDVKSLALASSRPRPRPECFEQRIVLRQLLCRRSQSIKQGILYWLNWIEQQKQQGLNKTKKFLSEPCCPRRQVLGLEDPRGQFSSPWLWPRGLESSPWPWPWPRAFYQVLGLGLGLDRIPSPWPRGLGWSPWPWPWTSSPR